jgi:hypothetical protein
MVLSNLSLLLPTLSLILTLFQTHYISSNAFDILLYSLLHHRLSNYGLSSGYLNWSLSYLTNRQSRVRSGILNHSNCVHFVDDLKTYRAISSYSDCLLIQSDADCVHKWRSENFMKHNFSKIKSHLFYQEDERSELSVQPRKFLHIANRLN